MYADVPREEHLLAIDAILVNRKLGSCQKMVKLMLLSKDSINIKKCRQLKNPWKAQSTNQCNLLMVDKTPDAPRNQAIICDAGEQTSRNSIGDKINRMFRLHEQQQAANRRRQKAVFMIAERSA